MKWNGSTEYEIEKEKLDKSKKSSYSPVVFKHGWLTRNISGTLEGKKSNT